MERKRTMKILHLDDSWKVFSTAIEDRFTDCQEQGKDHEKLLALKYHRNLQTYLAKFNELNSRVGLSGKALKRVITTGTAITQEMYKNIWRQYGRIPDNNANLLRVVQEAGIEKEELVRALAPKKTMIRPQQEKDAAPKGEQKPVKGKEKEKAPEKASGSTGPAIKDKYPDQEILWGSFSEATKGVPEKEVASH